MRANLISHPVPSEIGGCIRTKLLPASTLACVHTTLGVPLRYFFGLFQFFVVLPRNSGYAQTTIVLRAFTPPRDPGVMFTSSDVWTHRFDIRGYPSST